MGGRRRLVGGGPSVPHRRRCGDLPSQLALSQISCRQSIEPMANYGAIATGEGVAREAQHTHARRRLRIAFALVLLVVGVVLLATVGVSRGNVPAVLALIPTSSPSTLSPASEEEENVSEGEASEPTADTFATMLNEELNVLVHLGISQASIPDTDLDEACGAFRTPCVASVGACLIHFSVVGPDGKVSVDQEQCNCYAKHAQLVRTAAVKF